jgi:hypothetical protein
MVPLRLYSNSSIGTDELSCTVVGKMNCLELQEVTDDNL